MFKWNRLLVAGLLVFGLILIRAFEDVLFYDPLLSFFKTTHSVAELPSYETGKLLIYTTFRFLLNTILSILILWVLFRDWGIVKLSVLLYSVSFVVLMGLFVWALNTSVAGDHLFLFYVRRFLIQPIFLLLLIPAIYFQKKK